MSLAARHQEPRHDPAESRNEPNTKQVGQMERSDGAIRMVREILVSTGRIASRDALDDKLRAYSRALVLWAAKVGGDARAQQRRAELVRGIGAAAAKSFSDLIIANIGQNPLGELLMRAVRAHQVITHRFTSLDAGRVCFKSAMPAVSVLGAGTRTPIHLLRIVSFYSAHDRDVVMEPPSGTSSDAGTEHVESVLLAQHTTDLVIAVYMASHPHTYITQSSWIADARSSSSARTGSGAGELGPLIDRAVGAIRVWIADTAALHDLLAVDIRSRISAPSSL